MSEFYVQRKPSGYLGNSPIWWALNDKGYTAYLEGAKRFTMEEAMELTEEDPEKWAAYPCEFIDARTHTVFDSQSLRELEQWNIERERGSLK